MKFSIKDLLIFSSQCYSCKSNNKLFFYINEIYIPYDLNKTTLSLTDKISYNYIHSIEIDLISNKLSSPIKNLIIRQFCPCGFSFETFSISGISQLPPLSFQYERISHKDLIIINDYFSKESIIKINKNSISLPLISSHNLSYLQYINKINKYLTFS